MYGGKKGVVGVGGGVSGEMDGGHGRSRKGGTHQEVPPVGCLCKVFDPCDPVRLCIGKDPEVSEVIYVAEGSTRRRKVSMVQKCIQHAQVDVNLDGWPFTMQMSSSSSSILVMWVNHSEREGVWIEPQ